MAPLPKRKHSTQRTGKRMKSRIVALPKLVKCKKCGKSKLPHRICRYCGK
ncbi:50S ribosomal protein L32 [Candidatus Roizmanbacteria bacterium]|nr:50S ribosomal protein L32 [Candidatus Roizmanbacteria bacterium]